MDLDELKRDMRLLLAELGQRQAGHHLHCCLHDDRSGSLSVWTEPRTGVAMWKCQAGCGYGTIVDAVMLKRGLTNAQAIKALADDCGTDLPSRRVLDLPRAEKLIVSAHSYFMQNFALQEKYMLKRCLAYDVIRRYRIGFVLDYAFQEWRSWEINGWIIPITDAAGALVGVKVHNEWTGKDQPKNCWAPMGKRTDPTEKPKHGIKTLWPPPESFSGSEIFLCPGELKALAMLSLGRSATSVTAGEAAKLGELSGRLKKFAKVIPVYDDDEAGRKWRDTVTDELRAIGVQAIPITLSNKPSAPSREQVRGEQAPSASSPMEPGAGGSYALDPVESLRGIMLRRNPSRKIPEGLDLLTVRFLFYDLPEIESRMEQREKPQPKPEWTPEERELFRKLAGVSLPAEPFELTPCTTVTDGRKFLENLKAREALGPLPGRRSDPIPDIRLLTERYLDGTTGASTGQDQGR